VWGLSVQHKIVTGLVGLVLSVAVVTVLVGVDTEVKAELAPVAATDNRLDARPLNWGCAQEPWPYGCQWRAQPVKRITIRGPRPA
jgi:hypothetical protein